MMNCDGVISIATRIKRGLARLTATSLDMCQLLMSSSLHPANLICFFLLSSKYMICLYFVFRFFVNTVSNVERLISFPFSRLWSCIVRLRMSVEERINPFLLILWHQKLSGRFPCLHLLYFFHLVCILCI